MATTNCRQPEPQLSLLAANETKLTKLQLQLQLQLHQNKHLIKKEKQAYTTGQSQSQYKN